MKKIFTCICSGCVLLLFSCQKAITSTTKNNDVEKEMEAIIKKYPNLTISKIGAINNKAISVGTLKEFEDSIAVLSKMVQSIKVVTDSAEIKKLDAIFGHSNNQEIVRTNIAATESTGSGVYAWTSYQYVGNSEAGYYQVHYYATLNYYTGATYQINYITSVTGLASSSPTATSEWPHFPGYYLYTYNYTQISANYSLNTGNQVAGLAFNGTVSLSCRYHYLNFSAPVSGTSEGVSYNPNIFSSTFPKTIAP